MIDTIKIVSMIDKKIYNLIKSQSIIKTSYHNATGEIFYNIVNDKLEGTYSSSLSVRVGEGAKYNFANMYYIEIEGSYHKLVRGYNSHNGFYNLLSISMELIKMVENAYTLDLPSPKHWFLQRIDIAICFDLTNQSNIENYIDNLSSCSFPRRKIKHYEGESIYLTGSTTTLKIYNKLQEFKKHDIKKFKNTNFDLPSYMNEIEGFIRFECEIKKRKLKYIHNKDYIRIQNVTYEDLKNIWKEEFSNLLKLADNDLKKLYKNNDIKIRLHSIFKNVRAKNLYNFYILIKAQGLQEIKKNTCKSVYYKNISDLKKAGIDFSQKMDIEMQDIQIQFNPFEEKEIP